LLGAGLLAGSARAAPITPSTASASQSIDDNNQPYTGGAVPDTAALIGQPWLKRDAADPHPLIITYQFDDARGSYPEKYHVPGTAPSSDSHVTIHAEPLDAGARRRFITATAEIERVANVKFVPFADQAGKPVVTNALVMRPDQPMVQVRGADLQHIGAIGRALQPQGAGMPVTIEYVPRAMEQERSAGASRFVLHELCHAIGLTHTGLLNKPSGVALPPSKDTANETVMSYNSSTPHSEGGQVASAGLNSAAPSTLMPLDIVALQKMYGPSRRWGEEQELPLDGLTAVKTIGNGQEHATLDAGDYRGDGRVILNLNGGAEHPNRVGDEQFFLAPGTTVHHARGTGGLGESLLISHHQGGDTLVGGNGDNTFTVSGEGNEVVTGAGRNNLRIKPGTKVAVTGFDTHDNRDRIEVVGMGDTPTATTRSLGDPATTSIGTEITIEAPGRPSIEVQLQGLRGALADVAIYNSQQSGKLNLQCSARLTSTRSATQSSEPTDATTPARPRGR
jgi:hypothetical protein